MGKLLKIEWLKLRRYRAFIWLLLVFCVSVFGINYIVYDKVSLFMDFPLEEANSFLVHPFLFPTVWQTVAFLTGYLLVIPGLLIIMLTANEFTFRIHRQSVIDGLRRRQFVAAKAGLILTIGAVMTVIVGVLAVLFGTAGNAPFTLEGIIYTGYFFIQSLVYMSVALLTVMLFRRSGVSIGLFFLYAFIVENLLSMFLNSNIKPGLGYYLPIKAANKLIPAPIDFPGFTDFNFPKSEYLLAVSIAWTALLLGICFYRFGKSDL